MIIAMVVVLPAPLPPSRPVTARQAERDAVDRGRGLVRLDQMVDRDGGLGGGFGGRFRHAADVPPSGARRKAL
jgi:hypothetical protein